MTKKEDLPPPPAPPLTWRYVASPGDWWVSTIDGWFWFDDHEWKPAPMGPP